jgi:hypothetical protein
MARFGADRSTFTRRPRLGTHRFKAAWNHRFVSAMSNFENILMALF